MAVRILTDSTAYIPQAEIDKYNISVVSLYINDGNIHERELDMDFEAFYDRLRDMKTIPKSAQPSPEVMLEAMKAILDEGDEVLGVFISGSMSGTIETALMVAEMIRAEDPDARITILDSESNSMQEGYAVLSAAECALAGGNVVDCEKAARDTMARTRFLFAPHTLEYLERGGRIGRASALLGSVLKLVPVLTVENSVTSTYSKVRTYQKALAAMRDKVGADMAQCGGIKRACLHTIADSEHIGEFRDNLIVPLIGMNVDLIPLGPVIGAHVGPAVAIVYETYEPLR